MITVTSALVSIEITLFGCNMYMKCLTTNTEKTADYYHFTHAYAVQPIGYLDQVNVIPNLEKDNFADQEISEQEASQEGRGITKIDKQAHHTSTVY